MLVYKFGGASINDAKRINSLIPLIESKKGEKLLIVVSAMGKMTNAFETLLKLYLKSAVDKDEQFNFIKNYHFELMKEIFNEQDSIFNIIDNYFEQVAEKLASLDSEAYDFSYDQIVGYGEIISSQIFSAFLKKQNIENKWIDASGLLITDSKYRDARVNWESTVNRIENNLKPLFSDCNIIITQGFIGGASDGIRTTIGREGSDYSAAIFANCLDAESVTVWKDVPGILNANPLLLPKARNLEHISYHEAVELAFYGASVIHPRTLQPLKIKQIPLFVRSFIQPEKYSLIDNNSFTDGDIPSFIIKDNQILFSISTRDFSFIDAIKLTEILNLFSKHLFHIRLIQNSALNFSIVADENPLQLEELIFNLKPIYKVKYNRNLSLLSVRHSGNAEITNLFEKKEVLLELHSRTSMQFVLSTENLNLKLNQLSGLV